MILFYPLRLLYISIISILALCLAHPRKACSFILGAIVASYFFGTVDNIIALVLPFKPFHFLFFHLKSISRYLFSALITKIWDLIKQLPKNISQIILTASSFGMAAIATHGQAPFQQRIQTNNSIPPSFILLLNHPNGLQLETTDLLQLSNALLFMDTKLRDHVKISSQVRNLGNIHSVFSYEIRMLDSMGIHTVRLISQEVSRSLDLSLLKCN